MPRIEKRLLNQKAVLWPRVGTDRNGEPTVGSPLEINVRWEEDFRGSVDSQGTPIAVNGTIDVDRDITAGSILWLGELSDLPSPVTTGLMEALTMDRIPDIKGRFFARSVTVKEWRAALPTVVS